MRTINEYIEVFGEPFFSGKDGNYDYYTVAWNFGEDDTISMDLWVSKKDGAVLEHTIEWWYRGTFKNTLAVLFNKMTPEWKEKIIYNFDLLQ